jgi:cytochrome c-type biogenesis protein CcmH
MPLAAVRQPARGFPVQVVLDDSQAMTSSMKLSNFQQVVVGARISKSGGATANPGDLEGVSETLDLAKGPQSVSLMIDEVVQ